VLKRHGLKAFSTPFSPSRSNIDYAIAADASEFRGFLDRENLVYGMTGGEHVVRSTLYSCDAELFNASVTRGFETTHHDIIANEKHRSSYARKIDRWNDLRRSRVPVVFLYHHRLSIRPNLRIIAAKVETFLSGFSRDGAECRAVIVHQTVAGPEADRGVEVSSFNRRITTAHFHTHRSWSGEAASVFGRPDDDLFVELLRQVGTRPRSWFRQRFAG